MLRRTYITERPMNSRTSLPVSDEEIMRKIDELRKDPKRFEEYVASRMDKAVKNWRRR
jgi:hypothetical protein